MTAPLLPAVCPFKTCPCARSKRPRVYRHHAHMLKHNGDKAARIRSLNLILSVGSLLRSFICFAAVFLSLGVHGEDCVRQRSFGILGVRPGAGRSVEEREAQEVRLGDTGLLGWGARRCLSPAAQPMSSWRAKRVHHTAQARTHADTHTQVHVGTWRVHKEATEKWCEQEETLPVLMFEWTGMEIDMSCKTYAHDLASIEKLEKKYVDEALANDDKFNEVLRECNLEKHTGKVEVHDGQDVIQTGGGDCVLVVTCLGGVHVPSRRTRKTHTKRCARTGEGSAGIVNCFETSWFGL